MPNKMILDVLFRSASGHSLLERKKDLTSEELPQYAATYETREQGIQALRELGFETVGPASAFGVSIVGSPELVRKVFGDKLTVPLFLEKWIEAIRIPPPVEFYPKQ